MYAFEYLRAQSVADAAKLLASKPEAKLLAGGHTLLPTMKLRLASPKALVDLCRVAELKGIDKKGNALVIGAMTTHAEVAEFERGEVGDPRPRRAGRRHRRPARAPPRHHRRLGRQQRPVGGLSGRAAGARRHHRHQQARDQGGRLLQGPVRDGAAGRRDHHPHLVPGAHQVRLRQVPEPGLALRPGRRRRGADGRRRRASPSPAPAATACSATPPWRRRSPRTGRRRPSTASRATPTRWSATSTPTPPTAPTSSASWPAAPSPRRRRAG